MSALVFSSTFAEEVSFALFERLIIYTVIYLYFNWDVLAELVRTPCLHPVDRRRHE